jgi:hypothetical protein
MLNLVAMLMLIMKTLTAVLTSVSGKLMIIIGEAAQEVKLPVTPIQT